MTIVVRASATAVGSLTNPHTVSKPTGTAEGDLLILQVVNSTVATITPPAGFTLIPGAEITSAPVHALYWKVAGASEPASYDVGHTSGVCALGIVAMYSDTGDEIALDQIATSVDSVSDTNYVAAGVTVGNAPALLATWFGLPSGSPLTPPAGMTEVYDASSSPRIQLSTQAIASTGATGTRTATGSSNTISNNLTVSLYEQTPPPASITGSY